MGFRHYWNREEEAAACYKAISIDEVYQAAAYILFSLMLRWERFPKLIIFSSKFRLDWQH